MERGCQQNDSLADGYASGIPAVAIHSASAAAVDTAPPVCTSTSRSFTFIAKGWMLMFLRDSGFLSTGPADWLTVWA